MCLRIQRCCSSVRRRIRTILAMLCFILINSSLTVNADTHDFIRLLGADYLGDLPTLVAANQGIFRRHGLDIEVSHSGSGKQNLQVLRDGGADIALMTITPLVLEMMERPPTGEANDPLIIASLAHASRLNHVVALEGNGVEAPSDLAGRRVGLMEGTNAELLWWLFTVLHRIDTDTTTVVDMPIKNLPEALLSGAIDAAVLWEPWTSRLEDRFRSDVILLPVSNIYIEHWVLVSTRGLLQRKPDAIRNLIAAYRDAIAFVETSPDHVGLEAQGAPAVEDLPLFGLSLSWSLLTALMEISYWARESEVVAEIEEPPNLLAWIESGPLRDVMPLAVGIPAPPANDRGALP